MAGYGSGTRPGSYCQRLYDCDSGQQHDKGVSDGQLIGMLTQYLPAIAGQKYVLLDGKALVGYTSAEWIVV